MKRTNRKLAITGLGFIGLLLVGLINIFLNVLLVTVAVFAILAAIADTSFWNVFSAAWMALISIAIIRHPIFNVNQS